MVKFPIPPRRWKKVLYSWPAIVFLLVAALYLGRSVWVLFQKSRVTAAVRQTAASELESLEQRRRQLEEEIKSLATDRGREAEVKRKFFVAREGERVVVVTRRSVPLSGEENPLPPSRPWYQFIIEWFY